MTFTRCPPCPSALRSAAARNILIARKLFALSLSLTLGGCASLETAADHAHDFPTRWARARYVCYGAFSGGCCWTACDVEGGSARDLALSINALPTDMTGTLKNSPAIHIAPYATQAKEHPMAAAVVNKSEIIASLRVGEQITLCCPNGLYLRCLSLLNHLQDSIERPRQHCLVLFDVLRRRVRRLPRLNLLHYQLG